jgi:Tfp pilus tip-associated adhesin PilY1
MTFKLPGVSNYNIHNSVYFASYDPKSYCPNPPPECVDYCKTDSLASKSICQASCVAQNGSFDVTYPRDEILQNPPYAGGSEQRKRYCDLTYPKTQSYPNPSDLGHFVYYKIPGTFYDAGNYGNDFCYSTGYNPIEGVADGYQCYTQKTGTSDDTYTGTNPGQYGGTMNMSGTFTPTDEDFALGFWDFGRRMAWYWTGQTWFANTSPGGGNLDVPIAVNDAFDTQKNKLLAKLDMKENNRAAYMTCSSGNTCSYIVNAGLTPTAGTLQSAIDYFKGVNGYTSPIQDSCQKTFIVFVTDGLPSVSETGATGSAATLMPAVLTKIQSLQTLLKNIGGTNYSFKIPVYVLGMAITDTAKPYLDSMAATGGTVQAYYASNASQLQSSLTAIFDNITNATYAFATSSYPTTNTTDENFLYEASFTPSPATDPFWRGYLQKWSLNSDGSLNALQWEAGSVLKSQTAASRNIQTLIGGVLTDFTTTHRGNSGNITYQNLNVPDDGTAIIDGSAYKVVEYIRGDPAYNKEQDISDLPNGPTWKLGDIFHSNPITIGTPDIYFYDYIQTTNLIGTPPKTAFEIYRDNHPRVSSCSSCPGYRQRIIMASANDGQFHVFNATDGVEFWSFIPPNLLPKLQYLYHTSNPSALMHNFYVDGPITVGDVWLPAISTDGTSKVDTDWKTLAIISLGRDNHDYTSADQSAIPQSTKYWSSSLNCDTGITEYYDNTTAKYYCGYYAFDFTNSPNSNPTFKWTLDPNTQLPRQYLGEPWSAVSIGRVRRSGKEVWVGVIGGGYDATPCTGNNSTKRGKAIIVFDLRTGQVIWNYNYDTNNAMAYAIPAQVALVDTDSDGFIDKAFVGDIGGNMWQVKFCTKANLDPSNSQYIANCDTSSWKGSLLLAAPSSGTSYPIYTQATVAKDSDNNMWVFWGTGDKTDPASLTNPAAYVYGIKPCSDVSGNPTACSRGDLIDNGTVTDISAGTSAYCAAASNPVGWYMRLKPHEEVLAPPVVYSSVLLFTSFVPAAGTSICSKTGNAYLYGIDIASSTSYCNVGQGAFSNGRTNWLVGSGVASMPIVSIGPTGEVNIHVSTSGSGGQDGTTQPVKDPTLLKQLNKLSNTTNMIYWKDNRVQ